MDLVRRYLPARARDNGHKYAPLGQPGDGPLHRAPKKSLWTRKHSLLVVMLVLLAGMACVLATG